MSGFDVCLPADRRVFVFRARHIEPQQVATYESTTYQDILDDLVMVTDHDALSHAQAAAASDPSMVSAEFSLALLAATNEMIKETPIEVLNDTTDASNPLQYFYPVEADKPTENNAEQPPTTTTVLDESLLNTDLSSLLELETPADPSSITEVAPKSPLPESEPIDFDTLLPAPSQSKLPPSFDHDLTYSPLSDTLALSFNSLPQLLQPTNVAEPPAAEVVIDSGRLDQFASSEKALPASEGMIEDLLGELPKDPYEMIEGQGQTPKVGQSLEKTFNRYQQKYQSNLKRRRELLSKKAREQSLTIPRMKLKLNSIYPHKSSRRGKRCKVRSCPPIVLVKQLAEEEDEDECPPLKITIRTPRLSADERQTLPMKHDEPMDVECAANSTPVEEPAAEVLCPTPSSTSADTRLKNEIRSPSPPVDTQIDLCPSQSSSVLHSGFLIDEHTPPSSITSMEHKHSPPPLLSTQTCAERFKASYSHLFTGDNALDQAPNNETFTTPPPETDFHPQAPRGQAGESFYSFSFLPADRRNNINTESPVRRAARAVDRCPPWTTPWTPKHWNRSLRRLCPNRKESIRDQQQRERVRRFRRSTTTVIHRGIREISIRRKTVRLPRRVVRRKRVHPVRLPIMAIEHRKNPLTHHHPRPPRFPIPTVSPTITSLLEPRSSIFPSRIPTRTQRTFLPITRVNIMDSILLTATARRFPPVLIHNGSNSITLRIICVSSFVRSFVCRGKILSFCSSFS